LRCPAGVVEPSFNAVGAVQVFSGGFSYYGTGTALSPNWVLTAGHNLDFDDNGVPDAGLSINFHLPGFGSYAASAFYTHPDFSGFGNPSIQRDLGLLYFATPLPMDLLFPGLQGELAIGDQVTLAGFGRSGFGDYGYTTSASLTDRRIGQNVIDSFDLDDLGGGFPASSATTSMPRTPLACPAAVWEMIWKPSSARAIPAGHSCWTTATAIRWWA
jgi:hypothetical protein